MPVSQLEPELEPHYTAWKQNPTPATRSQLLTAVSPAITAAIRSYGRDSPTLRGKAKLRAIAAFDSYDPMRGKLKTHIISQLRGLQRDSAQEQNIIQQPEQVSLDKQHLNRHVAELTDTLGREPSDLELADKSGFSLKRIAHVRQSVQGVNHGALLEGVPDGDLPASMTPGDTSRQDAWRDYIYYDLSPRDQLIMEHSLGIRGKPKLAANRIAAKLRITPAAVSQRLSHIQRMLDEGQSMSSFGY